MGVKDLCFSNFTAFPLRPKPFHCLQLRAKKSSEKAAAQKLAQQELLVPLMPEGAKHMSDVQIAAAHASSGTYYAPQGAEFVTVAVPLANGLQQA